MAAHLQKIIHSTHPEAEEDELSELAMAVGDCEQARAELARHFDNTPFEECIIMSILHNGSDDACGFVCWALHALAADPEHRGSLVTPAVATGLREALAAGHEEVQWAVLRVLDQISGSEDGAHMLARCAGLRELLSDSTAFSQAMAELAHHISSNLPVGVEPVPDVKAPARVAAKVEAEELATQKAQEEADQTRKREDDAREKLFADAEAEVAMLVDVETEAEKRAKAEAKAAADAKARAEAKAAAEAKAKAAADAKAREEAKAADEAKTEAAKAEAYAKAAAEATAAAEAKAEAEANAAAEAKAAAANALAEATAAAEARAAAEATAAAEAKAAAEARAARAKAEAEVKAATEAIVVAKAKAASEAKAAIEAKEATRAAKEETAACIAELKASEASSQNEGDPQPEAQEKLGDDAGKLQHQIEDAEQSGNYELLLRILQLMCNEDGASVEDGEDVVEGAMDALLRLLSASTKEQIGLRGACTAVCIVMHSWMDEPAIVEAALSAVWKLASDCPTNCKLFEDLNEASQERENDQCIAELIMTAMVEHSEDESTLQEQACLAVTALAEGSASLAAALRDVGIIAELGYAKEERITNERNKSYPDKAIAALVAASTGADEPGAGDHGQAKPQGAAESLPEGHGIAGDGTAGPATTTTQLVNSRDQGQLRVGCIVDIPNSPRIPPMRIAHIDPQSAAAVLLGLEESQRLKSHSAQDPYTFLARYSRLRPLSALRHLPDQHVTTAHG